MQVRLDIATVIGLLAYVVNYIILPRYQLQSFLFVLYLFFYLSFIHGQKAVGGGDVHT
jgi:hypothetical protein